jgi:hypothetical protein
MIKNNLFDKDKDNHKDKHKEFVLYFNKVFNF